MLDGGRSVMLKQVLPQFEVINYGASPGLSDNGAAIQRAIDAAVAAGGGRVVFQNGIYLTSFIQPKSGVILAGKGSGATTLKLVNSSGNVVFVVADPSADLWSVVDLTLDGNTAGTNSVSAILMRGTRGIITRCEIKNATIGIEGRAGSNHIITDNIVHDNTSMGIFIGAASTTMTDIEVSRNRVYANGSHGIYAGGGVTAVVRRLGMCDNIVTSNGTVSDGGGIWAATGVDVVGINSNIVFGNNGDNIGIAGATNFLVQNNSSYGAAGIIDPVNSGIAISNASARGIVSGNLCWLNTAAGIILRGASTNIQISDNKCWNNSQYAGSTFDGITVALFAPDASSATDFLIEGNECFDTQGGAKTQAYGISVDVSAVNGKISANKIGSNKTGTITNASTTSVVSDNFGVTGAGGIGSVALPSGETQSVSIGGAVVAALTAAGLSIQGATGLQNLTSTTITNGVSHRLFNGATGYMLFGIENSAGGSYLGGTSAYSAVIKAPDASNMHFGTGGSVRMTALVGGNIGIRTTTPATALEVAGSITTTPVVVASLPAANLSAGQRHFVTDASTTVLLGLGSTVTGGGANKIPVYSDGSNWIIG